MHPLCVCEGRHIHVSFERTLERAPAMFTACVCVCAYQVVYVCAGCRISGVRNRKLSQPFGCGPNWLCTVDRMLTEHIAQTGTLFLSVSSSGFVKIFPLRNSLLYSFSSMKKNLKWCPLTSYKACFSTVWMQKKGMGRLPALMRCCSASYRAVLVYCWVTCLASLCVCVCGQTYEHTCNSRQPFN